MATSFRARLLAQRALMQRLNQKKKRHPLQAGFTLIELLIVVIIIGILASIALPAFLNQRDKAEIEGVKAEARSFVNACLAADITGDADPTDPTGQSNTCPDFATGETGYEFNNGTATATMDIGSGGSVSNIDATRN